MSVGLPINGLLGRYDPPPVLEAPAGAAGPFVLIGDHAGRAIPGALGTLGLTIADRARHIALDLGVEALGLGLSRLLDAPFVRQGYSRLVIDCNRAPGDPDSIAETSDGVRIPGNIGLSETRRAARRDAVFEPYHRAIAALLDRREALGQKSILISLHSFTPRLADEDRPWQVGILHDGANDGFARAVLRHLQAESRYRVGDNRPYRMDATDFTVPRHAFPRRLPYLEIEVRQDILERDTLGMANLLATTFRACADTVQRRTYP